MYLLPPLLGRHTSCNGHPIGLGPSSHCIISWGHFIEHTAVHSPGPENEGEMETYNLETQLMEIISDNDTVEKGP